jgi:hypothetical protein
LELTGHSEELLPILRALPDPHIKLSVKTHLGYDHPETEFIAAQTIIFDIALSYWRRCIEPQSAKLKGKYKLTLNHNDVYEPNYRFCFEPASEIVATRCLFLSGIVIKLDVVHDFIELARTFICECTQAADQLWEALKSPRVHINHLSLLGHSFLFPKWQDSDTLENLELCLFIMEEEGRPLETLTFEQTNSELDRLQWEWFQVGLIQNFIVIDRPFSY